MQSTKTGWIPKTAFRHVCTSNPTGRLTNGRIMTKAFALVAVSTVSVLWPLTAWSQQTGTLFVRTLENAWSVFPKNKTPLLQRLCGVNHLLLI